MPADDKTEAATPKRRGEARRKGNVAKSTDLSSIVVLLGLMLCLHSILTKASRVVSAYFITIFTHLDDARLTPNHVMQQGGALVLTVLKAIGPFVALAMVLGIGVNVAQTGLLIAPEALRFNFARLNPIQGAMRFFQPRAIVDLFKSLYKIGLVGLIAYMTICGSYSQLLTMTRLDLPEAAALIGSVIFRMIMRIVVTMLILAAVDFFYQRYTHEKSMRMTKQEVKDEFKQAEGSPLVKGRIRARMKQIAKKRMMAEVPEADVVVTNPTHYAVALKYDNAQMGAPVVTAKGQDLLAKKIRELAQENDVPIVENPPLARALYKQVDIGREIPGDLYEATAEVLAFVYQINQRRRERMGFYAGR